MHIEIIHNRNAKPAILLRESYRDGKKVRKRTLGNLSKLPMEQVMAIKRVLAGEQLVSTDDLFEIVENGSRAHGDVDAVMTAMRRLGFERLLCSRRSQERDLVVAMVAMRILEPQSKLATTRWWSSTTLPDMLGIGAPDEDELYNAMDWLSALRPGAIRKLVDCGSIQQVMDTKQAVLGYKQLANVERAFRCLKSVDLMVRPIWHNLEKRVRAHIFLCVLAYYVRWHMIEAWRPLLFADEEQEAKQSRDPAAPAKRSKGALQKAATKRLEDGSPVHSFSTLLDHLGEIVRNTCRCPNTESDTGEDAPTFYKTTTPDPKQQRALELLRNITV
jgi:hypothetical protein